MRKYGWMICCPLLCLAIASCNGAVALQEEATTVVVVRHAEKAVGQGDDPDLSEAGQQRARLLSRMLAQAGVSRLYATQYKRTQQTLQPLAEQSNLEIAVIDAGDMAGLVDRVKQESPGGTAVIAGHSNTVPMIIKEMGAPNELVITEEQYDDLFVVTLQGGSAHLTHLQYGMPRE